MLIAPALAISLAGLLLWALASNALVKRAGEYMFACGLLAVCFQAGNLPYFK